MTENEIDGKRQNYEKSKLYPANTLDESIELIEKIKDMPIKSPVSYDVLAKKFGLASANTKSLKYKISAAKQFGLITTSGNTVKITDIGKKILFPQDSNETKQLKKICFQQPILYQNLFKLYKDKSLPSQSTLENILLRDHGIAQASKAVAAKVFLETINELDLAPTGVLLLDDDSSVNAAETYNYNTDDEVGLQENDNGNRDDFEKEQYDGAFLGTKESPGFEQLVIPLGNKRKAIINMPTDATGDEAEYVKDMLAVMFKRLYGVNI